jgi:hypothetical protein
MTDVTKPEKAELREMDADFKNEKNKEKWTKVQFNPETLNTNTREGSIQHGRHY